MRREAGRTKILLRFRKHDASNINAKSASDDRVWIANENSEKLIAARLRQAFPEACFVGEGAFESDPSLLSLVDGTQITDRGRMSWRHNWKSVQR